MYAHFDFVLTCMTWSPYTSALILNPELPSRYQTPRALETNTSNAATMIPLGGYLAVTRAVNRIC